MEGTWRSKSSIRSVYLYCFFSLQLVGKYPDNVETDTYDISPDLPVFLSIATDQDISQPYTQYLQLTNGYFENGYKNAFLEGAL